MEQERTGAASRQYAADDDDPLPDPSTSGGKPFKPFRLENDRAASLTNAFPFSGWQIVVIPKQHSASNLVVEDVDAMADIFQEWFNTVTIRDPARSACDEEIGQWTCFPWPVWKQ